MHITDLITAIRPHLPFNSESKVQAFLDGLAPDDRTALVSALYAGQSHRDNNRWNPQYQGVDRTYMDDVAQNKIAGLLYGKNSQLSDYYDAFLRFTPGPVLDTF